MIGEFMPGFPSAMLYSAGILNSEVLDTETLKITAAIEAIVIAAGLLALYKEPVTHKILESMGGVKHEIKRYI